MKRFSILNIFCLLLSLTTWVSCKKNNLEELNQKAQQNNNNNSGNTCDTSGTITYTNTVKAIMDQHCTSCHNPSNLNAGYDLSSYQGVINGGEGILLSMEHDPNYSPMPDNSPKLDDCTLAKMHKWYNTGKVQ